MGMSFVDRVHGWITVSGGAAAGSQGVAVMRSTNGGAGWSLVATSGDPNSTQPDPSGLQFGCDKSPTTFGSWAIGLLQTFCSGGPPSIYRTVDGGSHWKSINLPGLARSQASGGGFGIPIFITPTDAVMGADYYSTDQIPAMLVTHDAGASWRALRLPADGSLDFESTTSGWILTDPIRATVDGGATWNALNIPAPPFKPTD
ncbi:MAG: WD40/YVTN/BNR-like repeat-containing protein, partial [Candidatus Dormibacteraceae bacterium]